MSQLDYKEKEIDGFTYRVSMLDPLVAGDLTVDVGNILAPVLAPVLSKIVTAENSGQAYDDLLDGKDVDDALSEKIEAGIIQFFKSVTKPKLREIMMLMAKKTSFNDGSDAWPELEHHFNSHFRGRVGSMYKWLAFAIRAQVHDFLG